MKSDLLYHRVLDGESATISPDAGAREVLIVCPKCKTMETILLLEGNPLVNRKFSVRDDRIYHDCGSPEPCRFFRTGQSMILHPSPLLAR